MHIVCTSGYRFFIDGGEKIKCLFSLHFNKLFCVILWSHMNSIFGKLVNIPYRIKDTTVYNKS